MKRMKDGEMRVIQAHPGVPPFVKQTALAYHEHQMLDAFCTTFVEHPHYWLSNAIGKMLPNFKRELQRRAAGEIPFDRMRTYPLKEIARTFSSRYLSTVVTDFIWEWAETSFDRWVANQLDSSIDAVHVYEHAAWASLKKAAALGISGIYEQPSQHHSFFTKIANEQFRKYPELKSAGTALLVDEKSKRRNRRRDEELQLASLVICNSTFTKRTLTDAGVDNNKVRVVPYGFPLPVEVLPARDTNRPLIFLNAGSQNLRKALHLLYSAWRKCQFKPEDAELWLIGKMQLPEELRRDLPGKVIIRESIPRNELMDLYQQADVFVLPTLADGFGLVISESMSRGLTVLTTENSGGPDIIEDHKSGLIVRAGDEDHLIEKMKWCVHHRDAVRAMGLEAWSTSKKYQWEDYRSRISEIVALQISEKKAVGK